MPEMSSGWPRDPEAETTRTSAPGTASAHRTITIDVDRKLDQRLGVLARWRGVSEEDLVAAAIEQYPKASGQRSVTVQVSETAAARLAAAAATIGMSEEELIAEAIDTYSPGEPAARFWPTFGIPVLLLAFPLVLMFASPTLGRSGSVGGWTLFALAMLGCCAGAALLISSVVYAEWVVIKYGVIGLMSEAACGTAAVLTVFAYVYWLLSNVKPASFNLPMSRVDAIFFALGTFTTTGTGRFAAQSSLAELLVSAQVVLGWGFVAVLVALLVPRVSAARKRLSNGRIIIRTEAED
jgi:predicted transcriptional regulator